MGNEKGLLGALRERGHKSWRKNVLISYHESFATDAAVTIAFSNTIIDTNSNSNQVKPSQAKPDQQNGRILQKENDEEHQNFRLFCN